MSNIKRVKEIYDRVAVITGFPLYFNDTDTPDINRFILQSISEALHALIDRLYINNNILERKDTLITTPNTELYGISGIVKKAQLINTAGNVKQLPYLDKFDKDKITSKYVTNEVTGELEEIKYTGTPDGYIIESGYLRLIPCPDKEYTIKLTLSTTDLVMSDNDESRETVESVDDRLLADDRFCNLVILQAAALIFARCQNANTQIYMSLLEERVKTYLERDFGSNEASRIYDRHQGNYNPRKGLLG